MCLQTVSYDADLSLARQYYRRAYEVTGKDAMLVRAAIVMPMIIPNMEDVARTRLQVQQSLDALIARGIRYSN